MRITMDTKAVAQWMLNQLEKKRLLYQDEVVFDLRREFGKEVSYLNENGNPAIDRKVLKEFKKLTGDTVIWERGDRCWRKRVKSDEPGRMQE